MKKLTNIKYLIIGMLISGIMFGTGAYAATTYVINANKISYSDNSDLGVDNVQAAIDGTCSKVNNVLSSKLNKSFMKLTLPTPTKNTSGDYSLTYDIDLSGYTEIVPIIYVSNFWRYSSTSYQIPPNSTVSFTSKLYSSSSDYGYYWDGNIRITQKSIVVETNSKSSNISQNHYEILDLYAR